VRESQTLETGSVVRLAVVCEGGLLLAALLLGFFLEQPPMAQIEWTVAGLAEGLVAALPLVGFLFLTVRHPVGPLKSIETVVRQLLVPLFRSATWGQLLLISILAGAGEEMLFRGAIQAGIQQYSGSAMLALAIASVLFGLAHPITTTYAVLAGAIGVYLGWLWLATGNLLVPIVTHAAYDFVALWYLTRRAPPASEPGETEWSDERVKAEG
jgi:hypothetical protein